MIEKRKSKDLINLRRERDDLRLSLNEKDISRGRPEDRLNFERNSGFKEKTRIASIFTRIDLR